MADLSTTSTVPSNSTAYGIFDVWSSYNWPLWTVVVVSLIAFMVIVSCISYACYKRCLKRQDRRWYRTKDSSPASTATVEAPEYQPPTPPSPTGTRVVVAVRRQEPSPPRAKIAIITLRPRTPSPPPQPKGAVGLIAFTRRTIVQGGTATQISTMRAMRAG